MLTLEAWAEDYLRPAMLAQHGLPDTPAGNRVLDDMVRFAFEVDCNPSAVFTRPVIAELLRREESKDAPHPD